VAALGACAPAEYTTSQARDDLVRTGWTSTQAQCFLNGLRTYYSGLYVEANRREDAKRNIKFNGVNPRGSDLYVRNELTNSGELSAGEMAAAKAVAQRCRP
jgi:hypothetical protein